MVPFGVKLTPKLPQNQFQTLSKDTRDILKSVGTHLKPSPSLYLQPFWRYEAKHADIQDFPFPLSIFGVIWAKNGLKTSRKWFLDLLKDLYWCKNPWGFQWWCQNWSTGTLWRAISKNTVGASKGGSLGKEKLQKFFSQKGLQGLFFFPQKWILHTLFDHKPLAVVECSDFYPGG